MLGVDGPGIRRMAHSAFWQPLGFGALRSTGHRWARVVSHVSATVEDSFLRSKQATATGRRCSRAQKTTGLSKAKRKNQILAKPRSNSGRSLRLTEANLAVKDRQVGVLLERLPYDTCLDAANIGRIFTHTVRVSKKETGKTKRNQLHLAFRRCAGRVFTLMRHLQS